MAAVQHVADVHNGVVDGANVQLQLADLAAHPGDLLIHLLRHILQASEDLSHALDYTRNIDHCLSKDITGRYYVPEHEQNHVNHL